MFKINVRLLGENSSYTNEIIEGFVNIQHTALSSDKKESIHFQNVLKMDMEYIQYTSYVQHR